MSLPERLASIGPKEEHVGGGGGGGGGGGLLPPTGGGGGGKEGEPPDPSGGLMQRIVIIQRDEKGYGFTVSGDNPVFVASVKADGAASRAGVQQGDRIVKVNGTLVTNRNHMDVVKLIKSGSYVALALLGKRTPAGGGGGVGGTSGVIGSGGVSSGPTSATTPASNIAANRDSGGGRVTAPQPVDPDKDRELQQQKINMTRSMYETAKEDFEKLQRQYVAKPSDKLHTLLLEKERTVKTLENQFKLLTGAGDEATTPTSLSRPGSNRFSDSEHGGLESSVQSWASSLPTTTSDLGSMSDSPQTSPSVSPTPNDPLHPRHNGQQDMEDSMIQDIITIDDEDIHSEDDQANDPGPFADIRMLESRPAHMAILLNYLISNSDPAPVLFNIISDSYSRNSGSTKELRKWAYEIYSTFVAQMAPLSIGVEDNIISQIDNILTTSASRTDNETILRNMFVPSRQSVQQEIGELLADFRNKRDLGMANFYGFQKVHDNMDRASEIKVTEELLVPILETVSSEDTNRNIRDRDQAIGWALATFLRQVSGSKSTHSATLDRVQTFMMKDKRSIKFPGSRSSRAKSMKGHQFTLQHCYVSTFCNFCGQLIWGVGYQGYQCQSCEMTLHKQCVEEITETCGGKQKKRVSKLIPVMPSARRLSSNTSNSGSALSQLYQQQVGGGKLVGDSADPGSPATQPYPKEEETDLAGLPSGHSVKSIINRYELTSPTSPGPGSGLEVPGFTGQGGPDSTVTGTGGPQGSGGQQDRKGASDLNRSGSLNNKGERGDRPARRAKSDVDVDSDMFKAINQSGSSSASSLSNRSVESPSQSTEGVNANSDALRAVQEADSDLELESDLPSLQSLLGDEILRKLKPKEKKRQEVINELFYTERNHLRNLKVLDLLFNRPMQQERGVKVMFELALALFPNMEEMIELHKTLVKDIKVRTKTIPIKEVGDLLLKRFDGEAGEKFRKGCAEYCRNQAFALEALKKHTRKEPKLAQFLIDAESNPMCRRLQLKDLVPSQMQRLTKYPLLIDSLMKHTQSHSEEYKQLEQAHEKCKHILAYVNQAVKECENYHKLRDIQRKLDTKSIETTTEDMLEIKNLDLSQHKLIFDGPLTWKLRSHRTVDLHLLLFDDMLVLLQKQDDKYVLKFQNTNAQMGKDEHKYSHGPVLHLKHVLARNLATDKKSFFVVNMTQVGAQMYEFTAATSELRIKWCKLINEKVDEVKRQEGSVSGSTAVSGGAGTPAMRSKSLVQAPTAERMEIERSKTTRISRKTRSVRNPNASSSPSGSPPHSPPSKMAANEDHVDGLRRTIGDDEDDGQDKDRVSTGGVTELIQPEEVHVDSAVVVEAQAVRSPLELLRQNTELIASALAEQDRLVTEVLRLPGEQTRAIPQELEASSGENRAEGTSGREARDRSRAKTKNKGRRKSSGALTVEGDLVAAEKVDGGRRGGSPGEDGEEEDEDGEEDGEVETEEEMEDESVSSEEAPEVLVAQALRTNARCLQIVNSQTLLLAQHHLLLPAAASFPPQHHQQQQQQQQQATTAVEEISSPSSPKRPLSAVSLSSGSEVESNSSNTTSTTTTTTTTTTATTTPAMQQLEQPREQLKSMAAEMNTILTKLMGAMNVGTEERHRLRQELAEAQERLSALKELQRQMTEAGVVPPDKILPLSQEHESSPTPHEAGSDIPRAALTYSPSTQQAASATVTGPRSESSAVSGQEQPQTASSSLPLLSSPLPPPPSSPSFSHSEASSSLPAQDVKTAAEAAVTSEPKSQPERHQETQEEGELSGSGLVHHGIQEATETQLEESVEALTLTPAKVTGVIEVAMKDDENEDDELEEEDDYDDDNDNEVSVKDLPLPDVNIPVQAQTLGEEAEGADNSSTQAPSSLLDVVELDDSDSDGEGGGGSSRVATTPGGGFLATTLEDIVGEEQEEGEELDGGEDEEEADALLRKISASSLLSSSLLSSALASPSDVDTEIITEEEEDNNNKEEGGTDVDDENASRGRPGSSSVDGDTTSPIEI